MESSTAPTPESRATLQRQMLQLPLVSNEDSPVTEKKALAIFAALQRTNLVLFERIEDNYKLIVDSLLPELEPLPESNELYVVRRQDIESIVARAAIAAAAQVAVDIGGELDEIAEFRSLLGEFENGHNYRPAPEI